RRSYHWGTCSFSAKTSRPRPSDTSPRGSGSARSAPPVALPTRSLTFRKNELTRSVEPSASSLCCLPLGSALSRAGGNARGKRRAARHHVGRHSGGRAGQQDADRRAPTEDAVDR